MRTNHITLSPENTFNPFSIVEDRSEEIERQLINDKPYYRSRLFTTDAGLNKLICASAPLFTLLSKFNSQEFNGNTSDLLDFLVHEIQAFETQARYSNYQPETILAARYVILATIDEAIMNSHWGITKNWPNYQLLYNFQKVEDQGNRVFAILDRISKHPALYIDLMELIYLSLTFNFKGKYRHEFNGDAEVSRIADDLYHKIRSHRKPKNKFLSSYVKKLIQIKPKLHKSVSPKSLWISALCFTLVSLFGFNYLLSINKAPLIEELKRIQAEL